MASCPTAPTPLPSNRHNSTHSRSPQSRGVQPGVVSPRGRIQPFSPRQRLQPASISSNREKITATYSEPIECGQAGSAVLGTLIIGLSSTNTNNSNARQRNIHIPCVETEARRGPRTCTASDLHPCFLQGKPLCPLLPIALFAGHLLPCAC